MTAPALSTFANGVGSVSADNLNTMQQTCDTYSDLRAFTGTTGVQVFVRGGSAVADGDQGVFYWSAASTAADNGSTIIAPTGSTTGRWLRLLNTNVSTVSCTASGTNTVVLTPVSGSMSVTALSNYLKLRWVQPNTTSGAVTVQFSSFSALPLYLAGTTGTQASTGDLTQNILYEADYNSALNGGAGAYVITSATGSTSSQTSFNFGLINGYLEWTVATNALTIAVKTLTGSDPSSSVPVSVQFRNATAATGTYAAVSITAALSVTVSNGSNLGVTVNSTPFKVWCVAINNAGTVELAVFQSVSGTAPSLSVNALRDDFIISTTAEGGAGAADSGGVLYSASAGSNVAMRVLGYAEWSTGLASAGAWAVGPTKVQLFESGVSLPNVVVQDILSQNSAVASGTGTVAADDSIPQNTEMDQYMTISATPRSAAHLLRIIVNAYFGGSTAAQHAAALFKDAGADAIASGTGVIQGVSTGNNYKFDFARIAGTVVSQTYNFRMGGLTAVTTTFNGVGSASARFGGTINSFMRVIEIAT